VVLLLLFCLFSFLLFLLLAPRSDSPEPPPPLLSSPLFRFTSFSSDLVLCGWDLLEPLGGSRLQRTPSLLLAQFVASSGRQNLLRPWMFCGHWVWGLLPVRDFLDYPILGIDLSKLLFFKSPNTRIAWHLLPWTIRFDFSVVCLGRDQGSKLSAVPDINCCGCSCNLLDCGQVLCRLVLLSFCYTVLPALFVGSWL
jgi:hypothetical protein